MDIKTGDSIHVKSKRGTYIVDSYDKEHINITCKKWKVEFASGLRKSKTISIPFSDYKCHAGKYSKENKLWIYRNSKKETNLGLKLRL